MQHLLLTVNHCECIRDKLFYYDDERDPKLWDYFEVFLISMLWAKSTKLRNCFPRQGQSKFTIKNILKNGLCFDLLSFTRGDRLNI